MKLRLHTAAAVMAGSCLAAGAGLACAKASTQTLSPLSGAIQNGELEVRSDARLDHEPAQGWDLQVDLGLTWRGQHRVRLDLTRTLVQIDGLPWDRCHPPVDLDQRTLFLALEPGDMRELTLTCEDVARPSDSVKVRLHGTGTGGTGVMELSFNGIGSG